MKRLLLLTSVLAFVFVAVGPGIWAQESDTDEFILEDIIVTAEKREVNVQDIPASVHAIVGADLLEQGKMTTQQILEDVPNVTFRPGKGQNPNGNVAIRGFQSSQETGVGGQGPSVTASYVDDVFQGIGGNYDVNRVEVLRGPQGTLYGRSSPAGVIAFHTNDPILDEFGGHVSAEIGTAGLINTQFAINAPLSDKIAVRAAGHLLERDSYYAGEGVSSKTKEGRVKLLFQPLEEFSLLASVSAQKSTSYGGGYIQTLVAPNEIDYQGNYGDPAPDLPETYRQAYLKANYDFGGSTLTYIGAIHDFQSEGMSAPEAKKGGGALGSSNNLMPINEYITHEMRLASDSEGFLTWLIGANYFQHEFDTTMEAIQLGIPPGDPYPTAEDLAANPNASVDDFIGAQVFQELHQGKIKNYGLFTEETYNLSDDFRITVGLRYDKTKINEVKSFNINDNLTAARNSIKPPIWVGLSYTDNPEFDNITYKLRLAYDLSPDHMVYALTATGFMPGQSGASPKFGPTPTGFGVVGWNILFLDEKELTSYEIGSKSQFFDNTLRLNTALYYYQYEGYQEAVNMTGGAPPYFALVIVPLKMIGAEISAQWLMTPNDRLSMDLGALSAEIDSHREITGEGAGTTTADWMKLEEVPGHPPLRVALTYDHSFLFDNGSVLVPRVQMRYNKGHYLSQIGQFEEAMLSSHGYDAYAYSYQDDYVITDINLTWTSADGDFSLIGYVRNALDERYKSSLYLAALEGPPGGEQVSATNVVIGDPRTYGLLFRANF